LWKVENYRSFLEARRELLADAANEFLTQLYPSHMSEPNLPYSGLAVTPADAGVASVGADIPGGVESDEEDQIIADVNSWVTEQSLPEGEYLFELADDHSGDSLAIFDLAWPHGLQSELSEPVALLLTPVGT
jgi:hypothetical protein